MRGLYLSFRIPCLSPLTFLLDSTHQVSPAVTPDHQESFSWAHHRVTGNLFQWQEKGAFKRKVYSHQNNAISCVKRCLEVWRHVVWSCAPREVKLEVASDDGDVQALASVPSAHLTLGAPPEEGLPLWPAVSTMILRLLLALNFFPSILVTGKRFWFLSFSAF